MKQIGFFSPATAFRIMGETMLTHYEMHTRNSCFFRRLNRSLPRSRRLAAMARAAAKRNLRRNRAAQGMAEGGTEAALESNRRRARLLDARGGRRPPLQKEIQWKS